MMDNIQPIKQQILASLPKEWPESLLPQIREQLHASGRKVVVLDDDPTGTQTVHGIPVVTEWNEASLMTELQSQDPAFYILTNSRSLAADRAWALNVEIGRNLQSAARQAGVDFILISRSDSTLRGHFPLELDALTEALGAADGWLLIPFFLEGGRYTINDVHYVAEGDELVPAAQTPFALDKVFGYTSSNLAEWIAEKSAGRFPAAAVRSISLTDLRAGGPASVSQKLLSLPKGAVCIVNSASYRDLEVFVLGLLAAEAQGRTFLCRTAASFVRPRAGIASRDLLTREELVEPPCSHHPGGLVVVGSHVPKTTAQLRHLLASGAMVPVEVKVPAILDEHRRQSTVADALAIMNHSLAAGQDVVVFTSRELIAADRPEQSLAIGRSVSEALVQMVKGLTVKPRYLVAKGGITASDIAKNALGIRKALIMGQILPGIPVWKTGAECLFPDLAYVVFPGNVGDTAALSSAISRLR